MIRRRPHCHFLSSYIFAFISSPFRFRLFLVAFLFPSNPPPSSSRCQLSISIVLRLFRTCFSPRIYNFPSLLIPSNYPSQPPPPQINHPPPPFHPSCPRKSYSSQRPTPRPQSIPAPNSPNSIPHFNPTPSLLKHTHSPTLGRKEKKGKARRDAEA